MFTPEPVQFYSTLLNTESFTDTTCLVFLEAGLEKSDFFNIVKLQECFN